MRTLLTAEWDQAHSSTQHTKLNREGVTHTKMNVGKNLGLGSSFTSNVWAQNAGRRSNACRQERLAGSSERADWQAVWQPGGRRKCSRSYGRQPALIPLVGITPDSIIYSNAKAHTYTNLLAVGFHLPLSWFSFLSIHIPILFIYNNPDGLF